MRIGTASVCILVPLPWPLRGGELGLNESVHTDTTPLGRSRISGRLSVYTTGIRVEPIRCQLAFIN